MQRITYPWPGAIAAVPVHDALHRREADAGPLELIGAVQPLKGAEQPVGVGHVEAGAVVAHEVGAVVAELRAGEPARPVEVVIQPGMRAVGDARLVRIALDNLIGNAWKFTRERSDPRIEVREAPGPDGPEFVVADNGAGFDMRYAANLFGPFQRMHPTERFPGSGIGLATVQRIVNRLGGTIRAESAVGEGTTFRFTLGPATAGAGTTTPGTVTVGSTASSSSGSSVLSVVAGAVGRGASTVVETVAGTGSAAEGQEEG